MVNEALAFGLPVIASTLVGATESLVRTGINGILVEPDNAEGLAFALALLDEDEALYRQFVQGSRSMAQLGDVARFVEGAQLQIRPSATGAA